MTSTFTESSQIFQTGIWISFKLSQIWQEYRPHGPKISPSCLLYLETVKTNKQTNRKNPPPVIFPKMPLRSSDWSKRNRTTENVLIQLDFISVVNECFKLVCLFSVMGSIALPRSSSTWFLHSFPKCLPPSTVGSRIPRQVDFGSDVMHWFLHFLHFYVLLLIWYRFNLEIRINLWSLDPWGFGTAFSVGLQKGKILPCLQDGAC